ncbi:MAG: cation diffusion facilitator family transporter [Candidatus Omnitrophica bacterium]|nr:cation diffusion facilitator family transporter [Candidatus Omnitrophota bacterium]MDD5653264.1 cation diffusion facilitator family transporter [Candidatus Omnitrophota bacterium]
MTENAALHYSRIRKVLFLILALNWGVAIAKILYGIFSRCESMTADGFHSLSDGTSNIIGIVGINLACQPSDKDHPYGHKKYETLFSLAIAAMLFLLAFNLAKEGFHHLREPLAAKVDLVSFLVMIITMGINFWVMNYETKKGKALKSDILISDAMHTKADIFTSLSVIISLVVIKLGFPIIDPIVTIIISLFIAHAGYDIVKESSAVLCDTAVILDDRQITDIVLGIKGVRTCHNIRSRGRPDDIYLDLHIEVNPDMHVDNAHRISEEIEEAIKKGIPEVSDVIVHIEPKEKLKPL